MLGAAGVVGVPGVVGVVGVVAVAPNTFVNPLANVSSKATLLPKDTNTLRSNGYPPVDARTYTGSTYSMPPPTGSEASCPTPRPTHPAQQRQLRRHFRIGLERVLHLHRTRDRGVAGSCSTRNWPYPSPEPESTAMNAASVWRFACANAVVNENAGAVCVGICNVR